MNFKKLLLLGCLSVGVNLGVNAQILNSTSPDYTIAPAMQNTGLAIAPNEDIQAAVFSDGFSYRVYWIDEPSGTIVDTDGGTGTDPDVAYYSNADALVVAYENSGDIYVDDYYLTSLSPVNYNPGTTTGISSGSYPNVDISSWGRGALCWEDAGVVWACMFSIGPFNALPPTPIALGSMPDIILMDGGMTVALTYVDPSGSLVVTTMDGYALGAGTYSPFSLTTFPPMNAYEYPRIASQRNQLFGPSDDFAVVAQDFNGSTDEVHAYFGNGGVMTGVMANVSLGFPGCTTFDPFPVIAYDRDEVHIAFSQNYLFGCSGMAQWPSPNTEDDVLLANFDVFGNMIPMTSPPIFTPFPVRYEEVNNSNTGGYAGISKNSISTEYDGNYLIGGGNYHEGVLFTNPSRLFWKPRNSVTPYFIDEQNTITEERGSNFSLVTSPVDQTIEVLSESDDMASFQLLDNAGRVVELRDISGNNNVYSIDISHLSGGMYFLHCSSNAGQEILRVLQVSK